jgi:hypothetical protein
MSFKQTVASQSKPSRQTVDIWPDFASIIGIGRNSAYAAAKREDFRSIRIGKKIVVAKAEVERLLTGGQARFARQQELIP